MTKLEKDKQLTKMQADAKDLQARFGFLSLQVRSAQKEMDKIRAVLEYQEAQFSALNSAPVDPDET